MAPEQLAGRTVTRTADVYAMGVVLWEVLAGTRLFSGDDQGAVVAKVVAGAREPPSCHAPNLPDRLDALVMKSLALDPGDRFATALGMAEMLLRIVPPAFPTDVGRWVERTARESLVKRGTLLAEIESSSDIARVPLSAKGEGSGAGPARRHDTADHASPASPKRDEGPDEGAPTIASQASSLSVETPRPSIMPRRSRRAMLVGTLGAAGGLLVVGLAVAVWSAKGAPAGPDHARTMTAFVQASAPPPETPTTSASVVTAGPDLAQPVIPSAAPVASTVVPTKPATPSRPPALPPSRPTASASSAPRPAPPSTTPTTSSSCDPPFTLDAEGQRHYKPECYLKK